MWLMLGLFKLSSPAASSQASPSPWQRPVRVTCGRSIGSLKWLRISNQQLAGISVYSVHAIVMISISSMIPGHVLEYTYFPGYFYQGFLSFSMSKLYDGKQHAMTLLFQWIAWAQRFVCASPFISVISIALGWAPRIFCTYAGNTFGVLLIGSRVVCSKSTYMI